MRMELELTSDDIAVLIELLDHEINDTLDEDSIPMLQELHSRLYKAYHHLTEVEQ